MWFWQRFKLYLQKHFFSPIFFQIRFTMAKRPISEKCLYIFFLPWTRGTCSRNIDMELWNTLYIYIYIENEREKIELSEFNINLQHICMLWLYLCVILFWWQDYLIQNYIYMMFVYQCSFFSRLKSIVPYYVIYLYPYVYSSVYVPNKCVCICVDYDVMHSFTRTRDTLNLCAYGYIYGQRLILFISHSLPLDEPNWILNKHEYGQFNG